MITVEKLLFPGIGIGCLFLVLATSMITKPNIAKASNIVNQPQTVVQGMPTPAAGLSANQLPASQSTDGLFQIASGSTSDAPLGASAGGTSNYESEDCSLGGGFPDSVRQWCELIDRYAAEHGLDPNLVAAVMVQESAGDPNAYSKSGAVGLMQVMPRDGIASGFQCINGPCFADRPSTNELFDPEFNVSYGARMLAGQIQRKGDVREALRSYGPMDMGYRYADLVLGIMDRFR